MFLKVAACVVSAGCVCEMLPCSPFWVFLFRREMFGERAK